MPVLPKWLWAIIALSVALVIAWGGWQLNVARLRHAQAARATAEDNAAGRGLEVTGGELTDALLAETQRKLREDRLANEALDREARNDPAGATALPDSVRERIARGDRELCKSAACR